MEARCAGSQKIVMKGSNDSRQSMHVRSDRYSQGQLQGCEQKACWHAGSGDDTAGGVELFLPADLLDQVTTR